MQYIIIYIIKIIHFQKTLRIISSLRNTNALSQNIIHYKNNEKKKNQILLFVTFINRRKIIRAILTCRHLPKASTNTSLSFFRIHNSSSSTATERSRIPNHYSTKTISTNLSKFPSQVIHSRKNKSRNTI